MTTDITELAQSEINDALAQLKQISEYPTPSTQYARVLRKYITSQAEALEKAQETIAFQQGEIKALLSSLESRTVKLPKPYAYLRENDGQIQISIGAERPSDRSGGYATPWFAIYTATGIKVEADSLNADVSNRNQPGMVVAVHIDVGDFVKFRGQVYEVKEIDFDDHDVTLWFVCGEVLKCAAGCPIEVVSAPVEDE
ncbi:hypothetical protein [Klebsiella pneumoniae]|uniref:hypothetical protein n=1 Tax=Klebsiella pneumoniae TaxID=573 RepID=UPI003879FB3F